MCGEPSQIGAPPTFIDTGDALLSLRSSLRFTPPYLLDTSHGVVAWGGTTTLDYPLVVIELIRYDGTRVFPVLLV